MARVQGSLQREREEQLQLRSQLANVYNVVRDLGLHYEMKEISGCSFITIGRTKHKYSQLDKNLIRSAHRRASDDVQYAEQNRVIFGDDTVSNDVKDETILNLHKITLEKDEEIKSQNLLLKNLSSQLQAANCLFNEEAENKQNLSRTAMEKNEEINRLNFQLSKLSSTLHDAERLATEDAEIKQNLSRTALKQEEEIQRLTLQLSNLSSTLQAKDKKDEEITKLNQKVERLSTLLETCTATKNKAEKLSSTLEESKEYWRKKVERSENTRISERDFANLNLQRQKAEICELTILLKNSESKLSRASQEIEDKDDKITVTSDQNKALNKKITKLLSKIEQQEEDHELQLAFQQNLTLKSALKEPSITPIKESNDSLNDLTTVLCESQLSKTPKMGQNDSAKDTSTEIPEELQEDISNGPEELEDYQTWTEDDVKEIIENLALALAKKEDTIATAVFDFFETAYSDDYFLDSRDRHDYSKAVIGIIMSVDGIETITNIVVETASTVVNIDNLHAAPNYEAVAGFLGKEIKDSLPRLMKVLHDDSVPQDVIANLDRSSVLDEQLMEEIRAMIANALATWKTRALLETDAWFDAEDEENSKELNIDSEEEENSEEEEIEPRTTMTSTPIKNQGDDYIEEEDEDTGKDENPKENTNDSGLGTSGITTSPQSKKSDCNLLKSNSTSSNPNDAVSRQEQAVSDNSDALEWKPLRPKWHYKKDPNYFHCHQDSPELCYHCSLQWGRPLDDGMVWDGEEWV
jgi:hypothetical protein